MSSAPATAPNPTAPFDIHKELQALRHEKKNQGLQRLPPNTTVRRRPINHAPIADIHAGAHVPKCVYVSRQTPVIAAVKRVKKLLREIEKRAVREGMGDGKTSRKGGVGLAQRLAKANEALKRDKEEVLVKASGRAMEQALRVGEWFRSKEKEVLCDVVVRTSNISVVDDIVEVEDEEKNDVGDDDTGQNTSGIECGDTTLDLLGDTTASTVLQGLSSGKVNEDSSADMMVDDDSQTKPSTKKRKRRKRPMYDADNVPEARLRWVKTVEVAISLKG